MVGSTKLSIPNSTPPLRYLEKIPPSRTDLAPMLPVWVAQKGLVSRAARLAMPKTKPYYSAHQKRKRTWDMS